MFAHRFLPGVLVLAVFLLIGAWTAGSYVAEQDEELFGTWTNMSEKNKSVKLINQKLVCYPGGFKIYSFASDPSPVWESTEQISSKWIDVEGNVWYKTFGMVTKGWMKGKVQLLRRLSHNGKVIESIVSHVAEFDDSYYPTEIEPKDEDYSLFYREAKNE